MSTQQFAFLVGFLSAALWAVAGLAATFAALLLGAAGWFVAALVTGRLSVPDLVERFHFLSPHGR
ncbi:hypothetical protein [Pilimelia columellifera]|uniref:Uncharacterized protein n=1 Tax=Pilimelia columellifera subsp. columellifera TaxID=706583 RepID=A0ABN3NPQ2_9ACTN